MRFREDQAPSGRAPCGLARRGQPLRDASSFASAPRPRGTIKRLFQDIFFHKLRHKASQRAALGRRAPDLPRSDRCSYAAENVYFGSVGPGQSGTVTTQARADVPIAETGEELTAAKPGSRSHNEVGHSDQSSIVLPVRQIQEAIHTEN